MPETPEPAAPAATPSALLPGTSRELADVAVSAVNRLVASGAIEKAIEEAITKTVTAKLHDALREYSDFGKQIEAAVRKSLAIHGDIDLPSYNHSILAVVTRIVESGTNAVIEKQVAERLKELLTPAPETIKLSELVEAYVEQLREQFKSGCVCYGGDNEAFAECRKSEYGWHDIRLAPADKKDQYRTSRTDEIRFSMKDGRILTLSFENQDVEKKLFAGPFYNFERMIFQMKAAGTKVEIDCNPADLDLNYSTYDD